MKKIAKKLFSALVMIISFALSGCNTEQLSQSYYSNSSIVETFTVTWLNYDGTILEIDNNVSYGTMPSYDSFIPTKASDDIYNYEFTGWTPELKPVTKDTTYTATFSSEEITYTITWENYDGTVLEIDENVSYGTMPTYDGTTPIKESDDRYNYIFAGWTPELEPVTEDITYTAVFTSEEITYTVDFDLNGGTSSSYKGPIEVKIFSKDIFFFDCVKEDWQFRGWEYNGEKIFDEKGNQFKNVTLVDNMVFKAIYQYYGDLNGLIYTICQDELNNKYIEIVKYIGNNINLVITETINVDGEDIPVKAIASNAFYYCSSLTSIYITSSVTTILSGAFSGCSNLTTVTFGENSQLTSIGESAFKDCSSLTSINIPDSVTTIGEYGFANCSKLANVSIGKNSQLTTIGEYAFYYCSSLTQVYIPDSVTTIGSSAFCDCSNLTIVTFGENSQLTTIGYFAFNNCSSLTSIYIPGSITTIGKYAFSSCSSLTSIYIPDSVTTIDSYAFCDCSNLTIVTFGENSQLTSIGKSAFSSCSSLTSINIPDSVTTIGYDAFYNCDSLTSIFIPYNVATIGGYAFRSCSYLTTVTFGENSQLTTIGKSAFTNCSSLTSINIPDSVTTIDSYAFCDCSNLTIVTFGENSQLTTIGEYAFSSCSSLTSIYIPDSVTSIGYHAFENCSNLTIYCEASSKPSGWDSSWNYSNRPVLWNCTYDEYLETIA